MSFPSVLQLSTLDGSNGFRLDGIDVGDYSGVSVAAAGDVNGDDIADLIIGATGGDPGGRYAAGESYVVFGRTGSFASSLDLSALDGSNGFRLDGIDTGDSSGFSVACAGDVNGDGIADLIIGAFRADPGGRYAAGESYVVFGRTGSFASSLALSALDGTNGFRLDGIDVDDFSGRVAGAGDVNGDGIADLIIGAHHASPGGHGRAGESYVVFGRTGSFASSLALSALDGSNGFRLDGIDGGDYSGASVAAAGDVNGDGLADLIIGARNASPGGHGRAGESYVVFGRTGSFASSLALSALDGSNGFRFDGIDGGDYSGVSVAGAGDVNGDGLADLIIGAYRADPGGRTGAGESYVVFGRTGSFASSLALSAIDGTNGFHLDGIDGGDWSGVSVAAAGDVNGDGLADLIIGASNADPGGRTWAGESYVVFGRTGSFASSLALSALDETDGFRLDGIDARDRSGVSVAGAGDVNGDGLADLIIGASNADPGGRNAAGETYVVFGQPSGVLPNLPPVVAGPLVLATNEDAPAPVAVNLLQGASDPNLDPLSITGFHQTSGPAAPSLTLSGSTLTFDPDDFNALASGQQAVLTFSYGISDGSLTTPRALTLTIAGRDEVITGTGGNDSLPGTAGDDSIRGLAGNDTLEGLAGNDTLRGDGGSDSLVGGGGDDSLIGGAGDDRLRGANGNDTLLGQGGEDDLSGGNGDDRLVGGDSFDRLHGGTGADTFVFLPDASLASLGDAADVIADFSVSDGDVINLQKLNLPDYAALQALFTETVDGTVIDLTPVGGRDILVEGVTLAELDQQANFVL